MSYKTQSHEDCYWPGCTEMAKMMIVWVMLKMKVAEDGGTEADAKEESVSWEPQARMGEMK